MPALDWPMHSTPAARYRNTRVSGCTSTLVTHAADGSVRLQSPEPLKPYLPRLNDALAHWAQHAPDRVFVARRDATQAGEPWQTITYAQMQDRARRLGQALLDLGANAQRPLLILSGNDLEHLSLALGAMWAGIPHVPASPAYSLLSQDHGKLRHVVGLTTPGVVFAAGPAYSRAIEAAVPAGTPVVMTEGPAVAGSQVATASLGGITVPASNESKGGPSWHSFHNLLKAEPGLTLEAAHSSVGAAPR